jgi:hydroxymethylbilane synthase
VTEGAGDIRISKVTIMKAVRVATRGSVLALAQSAQVVTALERLGYVCKTVIVKSAGDADQTTPVHRLGSKGVFEREVDQAVADGRADIAVHSLKDVPTELAPALEFCATLRREPPYDAFYPVPVYALRANAKVATGSIRRSSVVRLLRPDIEVVPLRGNVDTRIRKMASGYADAAVIAEAALVRMGVRTGWVRANPKYFVPSPGQGALGVVCRRDAPVWLLDAIRAINHTSTFSEVSVEREVARRVGAGCTSPLGVLALRHGRKITARLSLVAPDFRSRVYVSVTASSGVVERLVERFEESGGPELVRLWKERSPSLF